MRQGQYEKPETEDAMARRRTVWRMLQEYFSALRESFAGKSEAAVDDAEHAAHEHSSRETP